MTKFLAINLFAQLIYLKTTQQGNHNTLIFQIDNFMIKKMIKLRVFLIDHAWTYKVGDARNNLRSSENLLERMCNMMHISIDEDKEASIKEVYENMWKYNQTYKISTEKLVCFTVDRFKIL